MVNIIFLDIDGVLNCHSFYESRDKNILDSNKFDHYKSDICQMRIDLLNDLCKDINALVVISSTWRIGKSLQELQDILNYCGATFKIIGKTDHLGYERGIEISKWLKDNISKLIPNCLYFDFYNYVIIDDDSDMLLNQSLHFFQTDVYSGLTPNICYKIKRFFKMLNPSNLKELSSGGLHV